MPRKAKRVKLTDAFVDKFTTEKNDDAAWASDIKDLECGLEQVDAGTIKPLHDRALPLREAATAHRLIAANQVAGNIVLLPWAD